MANGAGWLPLKVRTRRCFKPKWLVYAGACYTFGCSCLHLTTRAVHLFAALVTHP